MKSWNIVLFCVILCFPINLNDKEEKKQQTEEWQIRGALAAFNDPGPRVQVNALEKLADLDAVDELSEEQLVKIIALLKNNAFYVRNAGNLLGKANRIISL